MMMMTFRKTLTMAMIDVGDLLDDVPQIALSGNGHQSIVDGHVVELSRLLVAEKRVRDPDFVPAAFAQSNLVDACSE